MHRLTIIAAAHRSAPDRPGPGATGSARNSHRWHCTWHHTGMLRWHAVGRNEITVGREEIITTRGNELRQFERNVPFTVLQTGHPDNSPNYPHSALQKLVHTPFPGSQNLLLFLLVGRGLRQRYLQQQKLLAKLLASRTSRETYLDGGTVDVLAVQVLHRVDRVVAVLKVHERVVLDLLHPLDLAKRLEAFL